MAFDVDSAIPPSGLPKGKRVLSGTTPTGRIHLGNYFGAIRQYIFFQAANQCAYFIADYHSMTTIRDAEERRELTHHVALAYLSLGLDPAKSILYRQSDVPEVHELTWALTSVTPMGLLERAHAYKDKIAHGAKPDHGLFAYPVLMAADILIHSADLVPVGQDQRQHLEMTRDIAGKFNATYGDVLKVPDAFILKDVAIVPGVDGGKMSKSYGNVIEVLETGKALKKQIMSIVTDSTPVEDSKDLSLPVFQIWNLFATDDERAEMAERARKGGLGYGDVKKDIVSRMNAYFAPAIARHNEYANHLDTVEDILRAGAGRARESAAPLVDAVRHAAGLGSAKS
jgi:tryptophanyl-tRNA synthetase